MITPWFKLEQSDDYLFIKIKAPYAKINEVDIFVEDNDFRFYCKPYYLRLNLPGNIIENEETESGTYDFDENLFKFKFEKVTKGQAFEGLDLLTKLLTPIVSKLDANPARNLIEEIPSTAENDLQHEENDSEEENDDEDEIDWFLEQNLNELQDNSVDLNSNIKYGFSNGKSNVFSKLSSEYSLIIDLKNPDFTPEEDRTKLRIEEEKSKFNEDHYLADYFDDSEMIEILLNYEPDFYATNENLIEYTEKEFDCLKNLPKKTYLLSNKEKCYAFCGLIDILYAYCYNNRATCGEINVESGWTIAKLSSTLSWFDTFDSLEKVVLASFRRSLCYPLYRNWKLSKLILKDVIELIKKGKKMIIKSLIAIREVFIDGECRYVLNDLYINDYCVWIQYVSDKKLSKIAECLEKIEITKDMVGFDLECLEMCGNLALEDKDKSENESSDEENTEASDDEEEEKNLKPIVETKLVSKMESLNVDENSKTILGPKIIELD